MEASTIHSPAALCPPRITIGPRLLRLRSDEQLVALFRAGHDEAFQVIYDRYHKRLESYARQMLPGAHDAEDALQDVFVRAYRALHADNRELAVRAWLFRVVHNRCIDELRRAAPAPVELLDTDHPHTPDPGVQAETRESLRNLIEDIRRLPEQQRAALLLRELSGISYTEVAAVLDTSVPAVKSLLVRARMGLVKADTARGTACSDIREQLTEAHDQGVRASTTVRRHLRDCSACRSYRHEIFLVRKRLAALAPAGPLAALAKLLGFPGGSATSTGGAAALGTGGAASGAAAGAGHVAALLAAAIATAGGAVGLGHVIASSSHSSARAAIHRAPRNGSHAGESSSSALAGGYGTYQAKGAAAAGGGQGYGDGSGGRWRVNRGGSAAGRLNQASATTSGDAGSGTSGQGLPVSTGSGSGSGTSAGGTSGSSSGSVGSGVPGGPPTVTGSGQGSGAGGTPSVGSGAGGPASSGPATTGSGPGSTGGPSTGPSSGAGSGQGTPGSAPSSTGPGASAASGAGSSSSQTSSSGTTSGTTS